MMDRAALIEAAAKAIHDVQNVDWRNWGNTNQAPYLKQAKAALPVIAAGLLAPLRAQVAEWREFMRDELELTDYERSALRLCASELERMLDQIEADVKGGE